MNNGGTMNIDDLLARADARVANAGTQSVREDTELIRDLAAALRELDEAQRKRWQIVYAEPAIKVWKDAAERAEAALRDHLIHTQGCHDCLDDAALRLKAERERDSLRALLRQTRHHALLPRGLEDAIDAALKGEK